VFIYETNFRLFSLILVIFYKQLIASQSPPSSPTQCLSPIARIEYSSVYTPVTPTSLPNSPGMSTPPSQENDLSPFTTVSNRTNHYNPTHNPTFVYHAAQPVDANHGRVAYIFGLFKIACYSIILSCCIYIGYQLVLNLHHDMKSKITSYESGKFIRLPLSFFILIVI
jgi:hypothetical protein